MSEQYIVSARKYRPSTFASVVGQKALTSTLKNAIDSNRLAQAYLFTGPRGVGKTSCARIFARTINCLNPTSEGEACGECASCRAINDGNSMNIIELDAASNNSVNDIRAISEQVNIPPQIGKYRVFIIDEVHMLTSAAFNAFLKTLEEPPSYVIFILATTEKHRVIPTILSRCQIYDFKRITIPDIVEHLQYVAGQEGINAEVPALNVIAKKADGAMRDALSIFDQVAASSEGMITYDRTIANLNVLDYDYYFRLIECFRAGNVSEALLLYKEIRDKGFDSLFFVGGLADHVRDLMVAADKATLSLLEVADEVALKYNEQAKTLPIQWYYVAMKLLNDCDLQYRTSSNKQFLVELLLIRLCQLLNPPTPPFDRVDEEIPLRVNVAAPSTSSSSTFQRQATSQSNNSAYKTQSTPQPSQDVTELPQQVGTKMQPTINRRSGIGIRLSDMKTQAEAATVVNAEKRQPVSLDDFKQAWEQFQQEHHEKPILISAMRASNPEQIKPEEFHITVSHPAQQQAFELEMRNLLAYLRKKVKNDFITLDIEISKEAVVRQLSPMELLKEIVEKNPKLGEMLRGIDAELV